MYYSKIHTEYSKILGQSNFPPFFYSLMHHKILNTQRLYQVLLVEETF